MNDILGRLQYLVNREMKDYGYTIKDFALRCDISYNEMRNICNGQAKDLRISTINKICDNSHIKLNDIFICYETDIEKIFNRIMLIYDTNRYSVNISRYR